MDSRALAYVQQAWAKYFVSRVSLY